MQFPLGIDKKSRMQFAVGKPRKNITRQRERIMYNLFRLTLVFSGILLVFFSTNLRQFLAVNVKLKPEYYVNLFTNTLVQHA